MAAPQILVLIAKILVLIATGLSAIEATEKVASSAGVAFNTLWKHVPKRYK